MKGGFRLVTVVPKYTNRNPKTRTNRQQSDMTEYRARKTAKERQSRRRSERRSERRSGQTAKARRRARQRRQSKERLRRQRVTV